MFVAGFGIFGVQVENWMLVSALIVAVGVIASVRKW